jgi:hypothetical protein
MHDGIDALEQANIGCLVFTEEFATNFKGSGTGRHQIVLLRGIFKEKGQEFFFVFFAIKTKI